MALSHIVMHLVLCNAAARTSQTSLPVHIVVTDKIDRQLVDQTVLVSRSGGADNTAEFDIPWGLYLAQVSLHAKGVSCSGSQFFSVLADHNRQLNVRLAQQSASIAVPTIINGVVPGEFSYAEPAIVVFGGDTKCDGTVGNPIDANIEQQDDDQAFYASVYPSAALLGAVTPAIRLKDSAGGYHYIRLPKNFISFSSRRPTLAQIDISDQLIDFVAGKPEDTLLCMRGYETTTTSH